MKKLLLTAMHSGAGKTVMTVALLAALKRRGIDLRAFKTGPDYIDPMFHSRVLKIPCRNLDLFLQGREGVEQTIRGSGGEMALIEGAMGYYDGVSGTTTGSAWETASVCGAPAVLILRPKGVGVSLAAQVKGMMSFRPESHIRALLLSECSGSLAAYLTPVLERETGLPVLGYLPPMPEAELESRHLGLLTAGEIRDLEGRAARLAAQLERTADIDRLLELAECGDEFSKEKERSPLRCRIAVAFDEAFCFYYEDSLDALRGAGAELAFFSPLHDAALPPDIDGLYLGGGYPELHAEALSANTEMRVQIARALRDGLPTIAECGGFLYLLDELEDADGHPHSMCGALPGKGYRTERLQRFGYLHLAAESDSMLFRRGERIPAHEFHYWDSTECGSDLQAEKPDGRSWRCGYSSGTLYAAFPHLHLAGETQLARRFADACAHRAGKRGQNQGRLALIVGGSASGKSAYAEGLAETLSYCGNMLPDDASRTKEKIYLATMPEEGKEARERIRRHRKSREGRGFQTIERPMDLAGLTLPGNSVVLLEDLGNLLGNELFRPGGGGPAAVEEGIEHIRRSGAYLIVVSNEIFSDGTEYGDQTERYRRFLAGLNRTLAAKADLVVEVVCGLPHVLKGGIDGFV